MSVRSRSSQQETTPAQSRTVREAIFVPLGTALVLAAAVALGVAGNARAQEPQLDVIYVPTPYEVVERMLEMAEVQPDDYVIDLGSGDGRIVIAAARDRGVKRALGIDLDPERVAEARDNARAAGVDDRVVFEEGDLFEKDISEANVLTLYLLQSINVRLRPVILDTMTPGTRVVSHVFNMEDWRADDHDIVDGRNVFMWIVPAKVAGEWQITLADGREMRVALDQTYQKIGGSARMNGERTVLADARLRGTEIRFMVGAESFVGRVEGDEIVPVETTDQAGVVQGWHARRI